MLARASRWELDGTRNAATTSVRIQNLYEYVIIAYMSMYCISTATSGEILLSIESIRVVDRHLASCTPKSRDGENVV